MSIKDNLVVGKSCYKVCQIDTYKTRGSTPKFIVKEVVFTGVYEDFYKEKYYDFEFVNKSKYERTCRFNGKKSGDNFGLDNVVFESKEEAIEKAKKFTEYYLNLEIKALRNHIKSLKQDYEKHINQRIAEIG